MAIEGRTQVDLIRKSAISEETRSAVAAVALKLQDLPLYIQPLVGRQFDDALASAWQHNPQLIVVDYLQLLPAPSDKLTQEEDSAAALRALKALALERNVACLLVAQLPLHKADRPDPRPTSEHSGRSSNTPTSCWDCFARRCIIRVGGSRERQSSSSPRTVTDRRALWIFTSITPG